MDPRDYKTGGDEKWPGITFKAHILDQPGDMGRCDCVPAIANVHVL